MTILIRTVILDGRGMMIQSAEAEDIVEMQPDKPYQAGGSIVIWTDRWPVMLEISLDDHINSSKIWLTADRMDFTVPTGEQHDAYPPLAFTGKPGCITVGVISPTISSEITNLSRNPYDSRGHSMYYPHCSASVETRDESVFAARNTIDGICENASHGSWTISELGRQ